MSMTVYCKGFLTGTKFYGTPDDVGMQGFGIYMYPDGTRYIGYFENGRFNGEGTFELAEPYNINFRTMYKNGQLVNISKVYFNDNLRVDFALDNENENISFKNWEYCTPDDRRFHNETINQILPVGPTSYQTASGANAAPLDRNIFDIGFGYLNTTNFLYAAPAHLATRGDIYVGCRKDRKWMRTHCRHGELYQKRIKRDIMAQFARKIIANNIEEQKLRVCLTDLLKRDENHLLQFCRSNSSLSSQHSRKRTRLYNMGSTYDTPNTCFSDDEDIPIDPLDEQCANILLKKEPYLHELKFDEILTQDVSSDHSHPNNLGCVIQ